MRKTKIICTLGPATDDDAILRQLMRCGMNVARLNFSHGDYTQHAKTLARVKRLREELALPVAALLDTSGPEIRIGTFENGKILLERDAKFTLTTREITGNNREVSITYKELPRDIKAGMKILIDDGLIELLVEKAEGADIACRVENGGPVSDRKGVNVPDACLSMPFISPKDYADIVFGIKHGVDFIAASFTRTADDIQQLRAILAEHNAENIRIIAKIENMQGVVNIDEIIEASDGIMVARGDMGVEIPLEDVPGIQKKIIKKVYNAGKPAITATQMLDSMMKNPRPTRAEATDVANAVYDGTGAIMLSGETAAGKYPVEALKTMVRIAQRAEEDIDYRARFKKLENPENTNITNAISHATCSAALDLDAAAIITVTKSGRTARMISKYRPYSTILGCTYDMQVARQLSLSWGVMPLFVEEKQTAEDLFAYAIEAAEAAGFVHANDIVVLTAGIPLGVSGMTNMLRVHRVK